MEFDQLKWTDVRNFGVEGKGWTDTEGPYDRYPARAKGRVPEDVWELSHHPTGLRVHFATDSTVVAVDWTITGETLAWDRTPPVGGSGLDLYVKIAGRWRWASIASSERPPIRTRKFLLQEMTPGSHEYMLYLPLLNSLDSLSIGVLPDAQLTRPMPQPGKLICFYGTSIVHGAFATRPGMTYPAILGRRLDRPFLNLGFCGSGRMEPEVLQLLAELDPSVYVLDALPNLSAPQVAERTGPFVHALRQAHPNTPILLVENIIFEDPSFAGSQRLQRPTRNAALQAVYKQLLDERVKGLHYVPCDHLLGSDGEALLDGIHPTDVGFLRMADVLEPVLKPLV